MKSSFRIYVVLTAILILEASASPFLNHPRQDHLYNQRSIAQPEYQGQVQPNLYTQPQSSGSLESNLDSRNPLYPSDNQIPVLNIPLPSATSTKTTKIQLPLATDTSKFTLLHMNPQVVRDGLAKGSILSTDVLKSVSEAESLLSNIQSDSNAYREYIIEGNQKPLPQSTSYSSAKATSTISGSGNRSSGYNIYPQYNGNQGASLSQPEISNSAASTAQATSSSFENQAGTNINRNLVENYLRKFRNHGFGNQGVAHTQRGIINAAQSTASAASGFDPNSVNNNNNNLIFINEGLALTQPEISKASQAAASAVSGFNSGGGSYSVRASDPTIYFNEENQDVAPTLPVVGNSAAQAVASASSSFGSRSGVHDVHGLNPISSYNQEFINHNTAPSQTGITYGTSQAAAGALNDFKTQGGTNNDRNYYSMNNYNHAYKNQGTLPSQLGISYYPSPIATGAVSSFKNQGETFGLRDFNPINYPYHVTTPIQAITSNSNVQSLASTASGFDSNSMKNINLQYYNQGIAPTESQISNSASKAASNVPSGFNSQGEYYGVSDSKPINLNQENHGVAYTPTIVSNSAVQALANTASSFGNRGGTYDVRGSNPMNSFNQEIRNQGPMPSQTSQAVAGANGFKSLVETYNDRDAYSINDYNNAYINQGTAPFQHGISYYAIPAGTHFVRGYKDQGGKYNLRDSDQINYSIQEDQGAAPVQPANINSIVQSDVAQAIATTANGFESLNGKYNDHDSYLINQGPTPSQLGISYSTSQTAGEVGSNFNSEAGTQNVHDYDPLNYSNEENQDAASTQLLTANSDVQDVASAASSIVSQGGISDDRDSEYENINQNTTSTQSEISDNASQATEDAVGDFNSEGGTYNVLNSDLINYSNQKASPDVPSSSSTTQALANAVNDFESQGDRDSNPMNYYDDEHIGQGIAPIQPEISNSASQATRDAISDFKSQGETDGVLDSNLKNYFNQEIQGTAPNLPIISNSAAQAVASSASSLESQDERYDDLDFYPMNGSDLDLTKQVKVSPLNSNSAAQTEATAASGFESQGDQDSNTVNPYDNEYINQGTVPSQLEISYSAPHAEADTISGIKNKHIVRGSDTINGSYQENQGITPNLSIISNSSAASQRAYDSNQIKDQVNDQVDDQVFEYQDSAPTIPETDNSDAQSSTSTASASENQNGKSIRRKPYITFNHHRGYKTKGHGIFKADKLHSANTKKYQYSKNGGVVSNKPTSHSENNNNWNDADNWDKDEAPNNKNRMTDISSEEFDKQNKSRDSSTYSQVKKEQDFEIDDTVSNIGDDNDDSPISTKQDEITTEPNSPQTNYRIHFRRTKKPAYSSTAQPKAKSRSQSRHTRTKPHHIRYKHKIVHKSSPATPVAPTHSKTQNPASGKPAHKVIHEKYHRVLSKLPESAYSLEPTDSPLAPTQDQYEEVNSPVYSGQESHISEQDRDISQNGPMYNELSGTIINNDNTKDSNSWSPINYGGRLDYSVTDDTNIPKYKESNGPIQAESVFDSSFVPSSEETSGFIDYSTGYGNSWTNDRDYSENKKSKPNVFNSQNPSDYNSHNTVQPNASDLQDKESNGPTNNRFDDGSLYNEHTDATPVINYSSENPIDTTTLSDKSSTKTSLHSEDKKYSNMNKPELKITTLHDSHSNSAETGESNVAPDSASNISSKNKLKKKPYSWTSDQTKHETIPSSANHINVNSGENNNNLALTNSGADGCKSTDSKVVSSGSSNRFDFNSDIFSQDDVCSSRFVGTLREIYVSLHKLLGGLCKDTDIDSNTDLDTN